MKWSRLGMKQILILGVILAGMLLFCAIKPAVIKENSGKEKEADWTLLPMDGQIVEIDGYKIKLEQSLFESETQIGEFVFSIEKKQGRAEGDITQSGLLSGGVFGENGRFSLQCAIMGVQSLQAKRKDNVLYLYFQIMVKGTLDAKGWNKGMYIQDSQGENCYFHISTHHASKKGRLVDAEGKNIEVSVSSLGMQICRERDAESIGQIKVVLLDGTEIEVAGQGIENGGTLVQSTWDMGMGGEVSLHTVGFGEYIDYTKISEVYINQDVFILE